MSELLPIDRMIGNYGELDPQSMADAIQLRQDVQNAVLRNKGSSGGEVYTAAGRLSNSIEPRSGEIVSDERLLGLQKAWQSDDIWE